MTEEFKSKIVWQENKDFGKVCTLTERALNDIINEATKELQKDLDHKKIAIKTRNKRIDELEKQIEKMKCCAICKHNKGGCSYHHNWTKDCLENNHKYFELKEVKE